MKLSMWKLLKYKILLNVTQNIFWNTLLIDGSRLKNETISFSFKFNNYNFALKN